MHAMRTGVHTMLGNSPGNLVFNRYMFLNIPLIANWHANDNHIQENNKQRIQIHPKPTGR
jgi:hypothetical protein